jgi:hypothetical protein
MLPDDTRRKIENITAGVVIEGSQDHCTAIRNFLCSRFATSTTVKTDFESKAVIKEEQGILLIKYSESEIIPSTSSTKEDQTHLH